MNLNKIAFSRFSRNRSITTKMFHYCLCCTNKIVIQPVQRINTTIMINYFKVKVCTIAITSCARIPNKLTLVNVLTVFDETLFKVRIACFQLRTIIIVMLNSNHVAIRLHPRFGSTIPALYLIYYTILSCINRCAGSSAQVDSMVGRTVIVSPASCDNMLL